MSLLGSPSAAWTPPDGLCGDIDEGRADLDPGTGPDGPTALAEGIWFPWISGSWGYL